MTIEEIIRYIMSLFGGGLVVALFNWWTQARSVSRQREIAVLQEQLKLLYGPLHFLFTQNAQYARLNRKVIDAYKSVFESNELAAGKAFDESATMTIDAANVYVAKLRQNNGRIQQVLENNWTQIDLDDIESFSAFSVDWTRHEVEEKNTTGLHTRVRGQLGPITDFRPEFVERVNSKWRSKRERLAKLVS